MSGLHRPMVVDVTAPNFDDLKLTVHCVPGEHLNRSETSKLCQRIGTLFENQGARVTTVDTVGIPDDSLQDDPNSEDDDRPEPTTDLVLEVRSRLLHKGNSTLSWVLCYASLTIWPAQDEQTFAQDITIRDGDGFLLVQDTLKGRVIRRFGVGTWTGNKLLNWLVRDDDEKIGGDSVEQDLSRDMYGQLSQLVFNAKMKWDVLRESDAQAEGP